MQKNLDCKIPIHSISFLVPEKGILNKQTKNIPLFPRKDNRNKLVTFFTKEGKNLHSYQKSIQILAATGQIILKSYF